MVLLKELLASKKRIEYVANNIPKYNQLIDNSKSLDGSLKGTKWYDDAMFIKANFMLVLSTLWADDKYISLAKYYITAYLDLSDAHTIEKWTKIEIGNSLWDKLSSFFSDEVSEKMNLNQFFYISKASLFENNLDDVQSALEDYKNAFDINPKSLWGQQALQQIKLKE